MLINTVYLHYDYLTTSHHKPYKNVLLSGDKYYAVIILSYKINMLGIVTT